MIWFLLGVAVGIVFMKIKRAVWCRSCVRGAALGHTRECQLYHLVRERERRAAQ